MKIRIKGKFSWKELTVILMVMVILVVMIISVQLIRKPDMHNQMLQQKKAVYIEYKNDSYKGMHIPNDIKVYFVHNVDSLQRDIADLWLSEEGYVIYGRYVGPGKIYVLDKVWDKEKTLKHEIAHHYYYYNLSEDDKDMIEKNYDQFCQDPNEFFAYMVDRGERVIDLFNRFYEEVG